MAFPIGGRTGGPPFVVSPDELIDPLGDHGFELVSREMPHDSVPGREGIEELIILKKNQCLFTFRVRDYTFVDEKSLALIFSTLSKLDISINIMQSSAITISVCFDFKKAHIEALFSSLQDHFTLHYMTDLQLLTLKNYTEDYLQKYHPDKEIILQQRTRRNCRFLVKS